MPLISRSHLVELQKLKGHSQTLDKQNQLPPFGPPAFYLKSVASPDISLGMIFRALIPFILLQMLAVGMLIAFPGITGR